MELQENKKHTTLWKNRMFLTLTTVWTGMLMTYYILIGYYSNNIFSWFYGLAFWYGVLFVTKILISSGATLMSKGKRHIDFFEVIKVYLIINAVEVWLITITPLFFVEMFGSKFKPLTITSIIINGVTILLFISSWLWVNPNKFSPEEYKFLKAKKYLGRTESFFNILAIILNILILTEQNAFTIGWCYFGIGMFFAIYSLTTGIVLIKKQKKE